MLARNHPDRIRIAFDDHRLVANAGLLLPVTLAQHLGLREVVDSHVDLGDAPGRANPGDKLLTLVASALAGGDFIDDADVLRTGGTGGAIGCVVKAPSTLGTFRAASKVRDVRQSGSGERSRESACPIRAFTAWAGPEDDRDGPRLGLHGMNRIPYRTGRRLTGASPWLHWLAGLSSRWAGHRRLKHSATWDVSVYYDGLRANTVRGAAHPRETVRRVRHAGATGSSQGYAGRHRLLCPCLWSSSPRDLDRSASRVHLRQHARLRGVS